MEEVDLDTEPRDTELMSRTSYLLHLYEKQDHLQQLLQQYEVVVKASHGGWLLFVLLGR